MPGPHLLSRKSLEQLSPNVYEAIYIHLGDLLRDPRMLHEVEQKVSTFGNRVLRMDEVGPQ